MTTRTVAGQAVLDAIADLWSDGSMPTEQEVAAAAIEAAINSIPPSRINLASDYDLLTRHAFLALVAELRGKPLPDASRSALAKQFPAFGSAPEAGRPLPVDLATLHDPAPTPTPVAEHPWERPGWCDDEGQCWAFNATERAWRLRPVSFFTEGANRVVWRWLLPASAIQIPAEEVQP